jgi:hypothetical protein
VTTAERVTHGPLRDRPAVGVTASVVAGFLSVIAILTLVLPLVGVGEPIAWGPYWVLPLSIATGMIAVTLARNPYAWVGWTAIVLGLLGWLTIAIVTGFEDFSAGELTLYWMSVALWVFFAIGLIATRRAARFHRLIGLVAGVVSVSLALCITAAHFLLGLLQ